VDEKHEKFGGRKASHEDMTVIKKGRYQRKNKEYKKSQNGKKHHAH
jgi:hypothetical protein